MCGIVGISLANPEFCAASDLLEASVLLQHRGQDACGIICGTANGTATFLKGPGLVTEVFGPGSYATKCLQGNFGIGHGRLVRYATNDKHTDNQIQPVIARYRENVAIAHNGNLVNCKQLSRALIGLEKHKAMGDSELMLEIILSQCPASCQSKVSGASVPNWIVAGLEEVYRLCSGSFACVLFVPWYGLIAFRDANGIKPLVMGERRTEDGEIDYMFASESVAFRSLGYTLVRDIRPGEAIFIPNASSYTRDPRDISKQIVPGLSHSPDIFEYVYFARTESIMDGISVNASRKFMGEALARTLMAELSAKGKFALTEIDCVIPVPETSFTCALALSQYLRKPLSLGLVRNRFIFRTFMLPNQKQRAKAVNRKLNVIQEEFEGKNVLIVDDSIVRGTTSTQIVKMAREAGAKQVYLASASPAIRFKHIHGIDLADESKLIAHGRSNSQIQDFIGCDQLFYLPLEELLEACINARCYDDVSSFEIGVFNGSYTTDKLTC